MQRLLLSSWEHKELTKVMNYCLTKDILPISTVDKPATEIQPHAGIGYLIVILPVGVNEVAHESEIRMPCCWSPKVSGARKIPHPQPSAQLHL